MCQVRDGDRTGIYTKRTQLSTGGNVKTDGWMDGGGNVKKYTGKCAEKGAKREERGEH